MIAAHGLKSDRKKVQFFGGTMDITHCLTQRLNQRFFLKNLNGAAYCVALLVKYLHFEMHIFYKCNVGKKVGTRVYRKTG